MSAVAGKATLNISDLKCHHVGVGSKLWWQGLAALYRVLGDV